MLRVGGDKNVSIKNFFFNTAPETRLGKTIVRILGESLK